MKIFNIQNIIGYLFADNFYQKRMTTGSGIAEGQLRKSAEDFRNNKTQIALQRLDELIEERPYDITAYINKSSILASINQLQEAQIVLKKGIQSSPYDYRGHYNMFAILCRTKQWCCALCSLKCTLSALNLIRVSFDEEQGEIYLHRSKDYWKFNLPTYILAAAFYLKHDNLEQALKWINEGIEKIGDDNRLLGVRASLYEKNGQISEAVRDLETREKCSLMNYNQEEKPHMNEEHCKIEMSSLINEMKNIFKTLDDHFKSKIYNTPENVLFLQNGMIGPIDLDAIIQEKFPIPEISNLMEKLPEQEEQMGVEVEEAEPVEKVERGYHYEPTGFVAYQKVEESIRSSEEGPVQIKVEIKEEKNSIRLYPLKNFKKVEVRIKKANITNNTQLLGKMDPYITVQYSTQKHKTKTIKGGGTNPEWKDDKKIYSLAKAPTIMKYQAWDHETFKKDDLIGEGQILLEETGEKVIRIFHGKKEAGEIFIEIEGSK